MYFPMVTQLLSSRARTNYKPSAFSIINLASLFTIFCFKTYAESKEENDAKVFLWVGDSYDLLNSSMIIDLNFCFVSWNSFATCAKMEGKGIYLSYQAMIS